MRAEMPEKPGKAREASQQQTLSLRISDALLSAPGACQATHVLEERARSVSTSEVAKQLLESAREDRLEVVDLMAKPTDTLLQIRRKGEAQHILSRAEWILLAHFVQQGTRNLIPAGRRILSPASHSLAVLDAFLAVYELRTERSF